MILTDKGIMGALRNGALGVRPEVRNDQIQPASLDLRMGGALYDTYRDEVFEKEPGETLTIKPWTFYLGTTLDHITLSNRLAGQMTGRSSFAREALVVHMTAGWADPGWSGELTLELFNFGLEPIEVEVAERVAQIVLMKTEDESSGYKGRYHGQVGPTPSRRDGGG